MATITWATWLLILAPVYCTILPWHGVNIPGLSFRGDPSGDGGVQGGGPYYPPVGSLDPWLELNCNMIRIPVLWNYIQQEIDGDLDPSIMQNLRDLITHVTSLQRHVIVDIHNFGRLNGVIVGQGEDNKRPYTWDLANLWLKLAEEFKHDDYVMFGIMNEREIRPDVCCDANTSPHDLDIHQWGWTMQYVIDTIRTNASANNYILVPGTDWQSLVHWVQDSEPGVGNVNDTAGKLLFDVHEYFDGQGGLTGTCTPFDPSSFQAFVDAMTSLDARATLTEFGGGANPGCNDTLNQMLSFLEANADRFFGWTAWGAGLDTTDVLYLNPNVSTEESPVDIVRDVLVPHMRTTTPQTASGTKLSTGIYGCLLMVVFVVLSVLA